MIIIVILLMSIRIFGHWLNNPHLTQMEMFIEFWPWIIVICALSIIVYIASTIVPPNYDHMKHRYGRKPRITNKGKY